MEKLREVAGRNKLLCGGLPGAYYSHLHPEKVPRQIALDIIKYHLQRHKFVIDVVDQVPPEGDIRCVKIITNLVKKYARYN